MQNKEKKVCFTRGKERQRHFDLLSIGFFAMDKIDFKLRSGSAQPSCAKDKRRAES